MSLPIEAYKGFAQLGHEINGKLWALGKLNVGGSNEKYDFKGNDFQINGFTFGGHIDETGRHWLIAAVGLDAIDAKKGLFEFKVWKNGEDGAKGSFDKAAGEELARRFQSNGSLSAINVDNIESLKALVSVIAELKIIVTPADGKGIKATIKLPEGQYEALQAAYTVVLGFLIESQNEAPDTGNDEATAAADLAFGLGAMVLPVLKTDDIPGADIKNSFGKVTGRNTYCFPYDGELPFVTPIINLPAVEQRKSYDKKGSGSGTYDPLKSLNARRDFIVQEFKAVNPDIDSLAKIFELTQDGNDTSSKEYFEFLVKVIGR